MDLKSEFETVYSSNDAQIKVKTLLWKETWAELGFGFSGGMFKLFKFDKG